METTINLIQEMQKLGFCKVITSPHVMSDFYKNTPEIIIKGRKDVQNALDKLNIDLEFGLIKQVKIIEIIMRIRILILHI